MRDTQRQRLYRAERRAAHDVFATVAAQRAFTDRPELQEYHDQEIVPALRAGTFPGWHRKRITCVTQPRDGSGWAAQAHYTRAVSTFRPSGMRVWIALHESAHHAVYPAFPGHGWEFAAAYIDLADRLAPPFADALRREFTRDGVAHRRSPHHVTRLKSKFRWELTHASQDDSLSRTTALASTAYARVVRSSGESVWGAWRETDDGLLDTRPAATAVPWDDIAYLCT